MVRISRDRMNMEDGRIDRAVLKDYAEIAVGSSAAVFTGVDGTYTVDIESGSIYNLILNANCSFTFSNPTGSGNACSFTLRLTQDWVGRRTVTWPAAVRWPSAVTPTLGVAPGDYDVFSFSTFDGGSTWFGFVAERDHLNGVGTLWSFGNGTSGRLGHNDVLSRSSPTQVGALTAWQQVAVAYEHTAALKTDGTLWSWGRNGQGRLGHNTASTIERSSPTQIGSLTTWAQISGLGHHTLALKTDGTLWSWGLGTTNGRLGHNDAISRSSPAIVGALTTWARISGGMDHSIALKTDGTIWTWGLGSSGQLGHNDAISRSSPAIVGALTTWAHISTGDAHTVALKTDGTMWTWGLGTNGRLGHESTISRSSPTQVGSATDWGFVAAGGTQTFAIKTDGTLWSWGNNTNGRLGLNTGGDFSSPTQVGTLTTWVQVTSGASHAFALRADGTIWSWGNDGNSGRLGQNDTVNRSSPSQIGSDVKWRAIFGGEAHTAALKLI